MGPTPPADSDATETENERSSGGFSLHDPGSGHPDGKPTWTGVLSTSLGGCNNGEWDIQGGAVGDFGELDWLVLDFMLAHEIPNGALCVVAGDGRLVYCKGFTWCDLLTKHGERVIRTDAHTRLRIASLSKAITAAATMAAVEDGVFGELGVNAPAFAWVSALDSDGILRVPELLNVRIRNLLTHSGGWVEDGAAYGAYPILPVGSLVTWYSPNFMPDRNDVNFAQTLNGGRTPIDAPLIRQATNAIGLTWDPAEDTNWSYNNYGWSLLGQILAAATGEDYVTYVQERVLDRIGATDSQSGSSATRAPREVRYYGDLFPDEITDDSSKGKYPNVNADFDAWPETAPGASPACAPELPCGPAPYCYFRLENSPSGSGWISSIYDWALLMRDLFVGPSEVLTPAGIAQLLGGDAIAYDASRSQYYAWMEYDSGDFYKAGDLPGTIAWAYNAGPTFETRWGEQVTVRGPSHAFFFNRGNGELTGSVGGPSPKEEFKQSLQARIAELIAEDTSTADLWGGV